MSTEKDNYRPPPSITADDLMDQAFKTVSHRTKAAIAGMADDFHRQMVAVAHDTARTMVTQYFTPAGPGHTYLANRLDEMTLGAPFERAIKRAFDAHFDRIVEEAAIKAMTHEANRRAFAAVSAQYPRGNTDEPPEFPNPQSSQAF